MAREYSRIGSPPREFSLLELSPDGLFFVKDSENGMYEIEAFLGDIFPICQVFRAIYSAPEDKREIHQVVALKLARIDGSAEYLNLRQEVENSFKIGLNDDPENNVITYNHNIVGIYKSFEYKTTLFCVSMPYWEGGSLRYMIDKRIQERKLPEKFIAAVLREVLNGLSFLHGQERVHSKLNAGNIFLDDFYSLFLGPMTIKLGYQASAYFHSPETDNGTRIWDESWDPAKKGGLFLCVASNLGINRFWTIHGIYEPSSSRVEPSYTDKSDIWNLGVMALELAFGPFRYYEGFMSMTDGLRKPDELRTFLEKLCDNERKRLPRLFELYLADPRSRNATLAIRCCDAVTMIFRCLLYACDEINTFIKKIKAKILRREPEGPRPYSYVNHVELSDSFTAMVKKCLVFDPNERPTAEELLNDPFFQENQDADMEYFKNAILSYRPKHVIPHPVINL